MFCMSTNISLRTIFSFEVLHKKCLISGVGTQAKVSEADISKPQLEKSFKKQKLLMIKKIIIIDNLLVRSCV